MLVFASVGALVLVPSMTLTQSPRQSWQTFWACAAVAQRRRNKMSNGKRSRA